MSKESGSANGGLVISNLKSVKLSRFGPDTPAGLLMTSLPWPKAANPVASLAGRSTYQKNLGQWIGEGANTPRRLLLIADGGSGIAPEEIGINLAKGPAPANLKPKVEQVLFAHSAEPAFFWERHMMVVSQGDKKVGMAMGLRHNGEIHWWEACRLISTEVTPECTTYEMGGTIPRLLTNFKELSQFPGYTSPFLHRHNWLHGRITVRAHANGVVEVFALHVSNRFYDAGRALEDVVPVIGFRTDFSGKVSQGHTPIDPNAKVESWDGGKDQLTVNGVPFDMTEVARLANPEQPGSLADHDGFTVLTPYEGCELFGGICPESLIGDSYIVKSKQKIWPKGMARSLRFSFSVSDRSPRVARYMAPAWLYGACEELVAGEAYLPVTDVHEENMTNSAKYLLDNHWRHGFEDSAFYRHLRQKDGKFMRGEPSWEGDAPWGLLMQSYRTADGEAHTLAVRAGYYFADVVIDHASNTARMHGYPPDGYALSMNRVTCVIGAYLETGDAWLLETAQSLVTESHWTHRNSWPRMAVGRDATYGHSAAMLYRYFADEHYRHIAHYCATSVAHAQNPEGSWGDQGGGAGIHMWAAYIVKPWMGMLATQAVLDYLDLHPEEPTLRACVVKFADYLFSERLDHEDGFKTWAYQHSYNGKRRIFNMYSRLWSDLPNKPGWYQNNMSRLFGRVWLITGDKKYLEPIEDNVPRKLEGGGDHGTSATLQYLPWYVNRLWSAKLTENGIRVEPLDQGDVTPKTGTVLTPKGAVKMAWENGKVVVKEAPKGVEVKVG